MTCHITPAPQSLTMSSGMCETSQLQRVVVCGPFESEAAYLQACLVSLGLSPTLDHGGSETAGSIALVQVDAGEIRPEGYGLQVRKASITITAATPGGMFHGIQTLRHVLGFAPSETLAPSIPCMTIRDAPRFQWRGFMLDESRHFFGKSYIKKLLDWMALLKMNRFHWHLTDEPAWRLEIKRYPRLTEVGATGSWSDPDAPRAYYTQDDIREIVQYAAERHIVIVPEIDMPGHATAANRAYPEYSGGGSERLPDFTFNPGKEETYTYLENILHEVMDLFPGTWIHFGADEVHFGNEQWNHDPDVQSLMAREGLENLKAVEYYFVKRMAAFIQRHGRTAIGWDEIVGSDIAGDAATVMWWRHELPDVLAQSYEKGFSTILCPRLPCYFDFVQDDSHAWGRRWAKTAFGTLDELHAYPPEKHLPLQSPDLVLGIQGNLWTERVQNAARADFMIFPRLVALAEAAWTPTDRKDFEDFKRRLPRFFAVMDDEGTAYFNALEPSATPEIPGVDKKTGEAKLEEEIQAGL